MIKKLMCLLFAALFCYSISTASHAADLSVGMGVLRNNITMTKTAVGEKNVGFTVEDFASASGCSYVEQIEIVSVPSADEGVLRFGSLSVYPGQVISQKGIQSLEYEPIGEMGQFTYKLNGDEHCTVCRIYSLPEGIQAPCAASIKLSTLKNISVYDTIRSENGSDTDIYNIIAQPKRGLLKVNSDGTFKYTPASGYTGVDSFVYSVSDKYGNESEEATVSIKIQRPDTDVFYTDMSDHYAAVAAIRLAEKDILVGEMLGEMRVFCPDKNVSRLEFLVMAMKAVGYSPDISGARQTAFADDAAISSVQKGYVISACALGIIDDDAGVNFSPDEPITYGEAAVILKDMLQYRTQSTSVFFPGGFTHADAIQTLADQGFTVYSDPSASDIMTRADTALLLQNVIEK